MSIDGLKRYRESKKTSARPKASMAQAEICRTGIVERDGECNERLHNIPDGMRSAYLRAVNTKSKAAAIRAKCQDCTNWQRAEIAHCTVLACPLWGYRPYGI